MTKIREIRQRILTDISNQALPKSPFLPQSKILSSLYGVSQPTLRKLLRDLLNEGHLERIGARYRLPRSTTPDHPTAYIQVVMGANENGLRLETAREIDFFRNLLHVSRSRQLGLRVVGVEDWFHNPTWRKEDGTLDPSLNPALSPPGIVGTILSPWHMRDSRNILARLFQSRTNTPIAIWMEESGIDKWTIGNQGGTKRKICFFDVAYGKGPGLIVAKHLVKNDILDVAYFSPFHKSEWSKDRLVAIQATVEKAGGHVTPYIHDQALSPWDFRHEAEKMQLFLKTKKDLLPVLAKSHFSSRILQNLEDNIAETFRDHRIAEILRPNFQKALKENHQAWVCANDLVALLALDLLNSKDVPKKDFPMLVGFDNIPETFVHGISSLECSTLDLVQSMIDFLQHPGHPAFAGRSIVRIAGKMYPR